MNTNANKILFLPIICLLTLAACTKTEEEPPPPPVAGIYHIFINSVNAIPEPDSVFFSTVGVSGDTVRFANETGYVSAVASLNLVATQILGGSTFQQIASVEYTVTDSTRYTVYVSGTSGLDYSSTVTRDSYQIPPAGQALVRFLNLCPNASIMDFLLIEEATLDSTQSINRWYDGQNAGDLDFADYQFTQIPAGEYTLKFFADNADNAQHSDFSFQVSDQEVMTIVALGLFNEPFPYQLKGMKVVH